MREDLIKEISKLLSVGLDNNDVIIVEGGESLTEAELADSFAIYAPFGDVDITTLLYNKSTLSSLTLLGGAQIFGRPLSLAVASGSNPLVVYVKR